jgi:hypothetical protein
VTVGAGFDQRLSKVGLGKRIAGTWVMSSTLQGFPPLTSLVTFNADGGFTGTSTNDFGLGDVENEGVNSPEFGTWERTDLRQIATTSLKLGYTASGMLQYKFRIPGRLTFNEDFTGAEGPFAVEIFLPGQDPLDSAVGPVAVLHGVLEVERLQVTPVPGE